MIINLKMNDDSTLCNSMIIVLKEFVNHVYLNYNIDMLICKPTCEQMSIINMSEKEIYCELRNSLMTILKKINSKESILNIKDYKKLFGYNKEELLLISDIVFLTEVFNCDIKNDKMNYLIEYSDKLIKQIISNMVSCYISEFMKLYQDFTSSNIISITSKEKSEYFKICEGDNLEVSYNTISECIKERNIKKLNK